MKAARYHLTDHQYILQCDDMAVPICRENEARVRVAFSGICGSDLVRYRQISKPSASLKNLFGKISPTQGHEFSGVIDQIGSRVIERWEDTSAVIGTRVAVHPLIGCGECIACHTNRWNDCLHPEKSQVIGVHRDGGFAEWVTVPFDHVVRVPNNVSLEAAALTEPLAVAIHAVNVAQISNLETPVTIIGDGTIGLLIAHVLKQRAYAVVRLIGRHLHRLELARSMGADIVQNARDIDQATEAAEYIFQVAGSPAAVEMGMTMLAVGGKMICLGYLDSQSDALGSIPFNSLIRNQKILRGSFGSSRAEFESALQGLAAGTFDVSPLIGAKISLDDIVGNGFEKLLQGDKPSGKILVSA